MHGMLFQEINKKLWPLYFEIWLPYFKIWPPYFECSGTGTVLLDGKN